MGPAVKLPFGDTVVVLRPTADGKDRYGNKKPGTPTQTTYTGCCVYPSDGNASAANEYTQGVDQVAYALVVIFPDPDADVTATDQLVVRGETWDVYGVPAVYRSPFTGTFGGIQVNAIKHKG